MSSRSEHAHFGPIISGIDQNLLTIFINYDFKSKDTFIPQLRLSKQAPNSRFKARLPKALTTY